MNVSKRKQVKQGTIKPIRPFKSITEEAAFWDTHSVVDEIDEGTLVGFHQANKTGILTVRFSQEDLQRLREEALQKGIGPTTLVRMWIKERLAVHH
jgi:predicted DNA binding CopG/RHH family protein